jgi:tRNA threonylcarbamoyladenosine biosynthesis protein TsaB
MSAGDRAERALRAERVLAIDTATEACSAALLLPGDRVAARFELTERSHADLILPMIDEVLREAGLKLQELDGLAFGRGPGGFTGLRVAAGVIQGLAYGANLLVAPVSSLAALAYPLLYDSSDLCGAPQGPVLVCNDARMQEVYWGCFARDSSNCGEPRVLNGEHVTPAASVVVPAEVVRFAGNAFAREPQLRARLEASGLVFHEDRYPRAESVARIGAAILREGRGVTAEHAVPVYVRNDVARPATRPVTVM